MKALSSNALKNNKILAKELGVDASTISRRKKRLIQNNTMRIMNCFDAEKYGLSNSAWFAFKVQYQQSEVAAKQLAMLSQVIMVTQSAGRYNLIIFAVFKNKEDLAEFMLEETKNIKGLSESVTLVSLKRFKGRFLPLSVDNIFPKDSLDNRIARSLTTIPPMSSYSLADKYGADASTIRRRRHKMLNGGKMYVLPAFNPEALGLNVTTLIAFNAGYENLEVVAKTIAEHPQVTWVDITSGKFELIVSAVFKSHDDLNRFMVNKTKQFREITESETFILINKHKGGYHSLSDYIEKKILAFV